MNGHPAPMGAVLYTVRGPRGSYFAVHDPASGRVFTGRTEHAARQQADDEGLFLVSEELISHQDLMRRTGRDADSASRPPIATPNAAPEAPPEAPSPDSIGQVTPLPVQSPFLLDDTGETLMVRRNGLGAGFFSSHPLEPQYSDLSDNSVLQGQLPPVLNPPEEDWKAPERH